MPAATFQAAASAIPNFIGDTVDQAPAADHIIACEGCPNQKTYGGAVPAKGGFPPIPWKAFPCARSAKVKRKEEAPEIPSKASLRALIKAAEAFDKTATEPRWPLFSSSADYGTATYAVFESWTRSSRPAPSGYARRQTSDSNLARSRPRMLAAPFRCRIIGSGAPTLDKRRRRFLQQDSYSRMVWARWRTMI
jgi:hypothetical protein